MDNDPPSTNRAYEPVPPVRRSVFGGIINTTRDRLFGSGQQLVEAPFPDTRYDGENPDWAETEELHGEFMSAVQAEPNPRDPLPPEAINAFPQETQTIAAAVNDQLLHVLRHVVNEERQDELEFLFTELQQMYPVWENIWRLVLQQPDPIDVAYIDNHYTPPLARIHAVAFRSHYKYNAFLVSSHKPTLDNTVETWIDHAMVRAKVKHMRKIIVEIGVEHQDTQHHIVVDSPTLYRLVKIAMAIYPVHKALDIIEVQLKYYNWDRTFHVPLPTIAADLMMPIVQNLLTQAKDYKAGNLPASTWLPVASINAWPQSRIDEMVRVNLAFQHARLMEVYLDRMRAPDIVNHLQKEYDELK